MRLHAVNQLGLLFAGILVVFGQPSLSTNINYSELDGRIFSVAQPLLLQIPVFMIASCIEAGPEALKLSN